MLSRSDFLGSGFVIGTGLSVELGSQFARTVVLARILGASEFGLVAAAFSLVAIVEMAGSIGLDRYLVYSADGGEQRALDASHTLALARGVLSAVVLAILAQPAAAIIGESQYVGSFVFVATIPFLRGFTHLGVAQMQRDGCFWRSAVAEGGGTFFGFVVAIVAARLLPDHRAGLWSLGGQTVATVLATHVLSRARVYQLSFDWRGIKEPLRYGLPLTVNGLAVAIATQLDRLVVGAWLGVAALGVYTLTVSLIVQPLSLVARLVTTLLQPLLSSAWRSDPSGRLRRQAWRIVLGSGLLGLVGATGVMFLGAPTLFLVFGPRYFVDDSVFVIFGAVVLLRSVRNPLSLLGLAIGRTSDLMVSNLAGAVGLLVAVAALFVRPTIAASVFGIMVGDFLSFIVLEMRLHAYLDKFRRPALTTLAAASLVLALLAAWMLIGGPDLWFRVAATAIVAALAILAARKLSSWTLRLDNGAAERGSSIL